MLQPISVKTKNRCPN